MKTNIKKSDIAKVLIPMLLVAVIMMHAFLKKNVADHLVINEIAFSAEDGIDWIEIYNPTMNNLSLENLYLSDKASDFSQFKIREQVTVPSRGFAVVYCEGYEGDTSGTVVTNFRISNGETVYLVSSDGSSVIDSMTAIEEENDKESGSVIGRFPDGSDEIFVMSQATPGEANQKDKPSEIR